MGVNPRRRSHPFCKRKRCVQYRSKIVGRLEGETRTCRRSPAPSPKPDNAHLHLRWLRQAQPAPRPEPAEGWSLSLSNGRNPNPCSFFPLTLTLRYGLSSGGGETNAIHCQSTFRLAGVAARTLHYYDEIGLLTPADRRQRLPLLRRRSRAAPAADPVLPGAGV